MRDVWINHAAAALLFVPLAGLAAQETGQEALEIRPGDPRLADFSIEPFVATYQVYVDTDSGVQHAEYWKWHLQESTVQGQPAFKLVWSLYFPQVAVNDQIVFYARTFRPVMRTIFSWRGTDIVDFTGPKPRYTYVPLASFPDSSVTTRDLEIEGERFGGGDLLALAAAGLERGDRFRMALYATDPGPTLGTSRWESGTVVGTETISVGARRYETLVVERDIWTLWIAAEPPYVIRRAARNRRWELVDVWPTAFGQR